MVGCTVCGNLVMVLEELTDEELEHYVCPECREKEDKTHTA